MADAVEALLCAAIRFGAGDEFAHGVHDGGEREECAEAEECEGGRLLRGAAHFSAEQKTEAAADRSLRDGEQRGVQFVTRCFGFHEAEDASLCVPVEH